ncbi:Methyl CpG binding protein 2 (Rett syndrome), partial [Caligus rogercresseyi]
RPLYRPHPTRPASGPPAMPPPPPTSSPVNASSTSSSVVAAAAGSSSSSGSGPRSQFTRVISSPPHQSSSQQGAQNNPPSGSPSSLILASSPPTAACSPTPVSTPKFRYPSGPSGASPRTTTPSSTLSSREGTPLPSDVGSAPNVDISRVHLEDFFHNNYSPSSSSSSSTPTRGAAAIKSEFPPQGSAFSSLSAYNAPGFLYGPQQFLGSPPPAPSQQCITLSQRSQMRSSSSKSGLDFPGAPRGRRPGSTSAAAVNLGGGGANVKIGRRPAHLPKNLKFDDKTLPPGWVRKLKQRKHGKQAGRWDFASRKKLKSFFEKNNLNYDPEDFDFTPYGRHLDAAARASASSNNNNSSGSSALLGNSGSSDLINSGRHNSSGSTGSEGTHEGSSPASLQNCSPTHHPPHGASSLYPSVSGPSFGSHLSGAEYSYPSFDPLMENPPNASALDVPAPPPGTEIYNHRIQLKNESRSSPAGYFPMEMAEILGDGTLNGIVPSQDSSNLSPSSAALHQSAAHLGQLHAVAASHHSTLNSPSSFSDLRSRMLGESPESEDNAAAKNMRPLLNPPPLGSSELQPLEKTFSIRNTISLLESGNDPYTNYPEYE